MIHSPAQYLLDHTAEKVDRSRLFSEAKESLPALIIDRKYRGKFDASRACIHHLKEGGRHW